MTNLIGQQLGQYQIIAPLGEGGMATVYRAHQISIRRDVAIKIIESKLARNPEFVKRFEREAMTIAALDHPHILKVFDFGQADELLYLVMDLKTGGSLTQKIRGGQLAPLQVVRYLNQVASALVHAHAKGVIHRDLKPQNVLLDTNDNAFLTDFGIAKLMVGDATALTGSGIAMGTPGYMAPEQWYGQQIDARTDIYALAVVVFEMLTGQTPFRGDTPAALMYQHLNEAPPSLSQYRHDLPAGVEQVLAKALAKQPDERYQSAEAFAAAFQEALANNAPTNIDLAEVRKPFTPVRKQNLGTAPSQAIDVNAVPSRRKTLPMLVLGVAVLAVLIIAGIGILGRGDNSPTPTVSSSTAMPLSVASNLTETATPTTLTSTSTATATDAFTETPTVSQTATVTLTQTLVPATPTEMPNLETQVAAVFATDTQGTLNAIASFTHTATLDLPKTAIVLANQTRTAIIIASMTKTFTPTATFTETATPSATSSFTSTPTMTFTPTKVPTATVTASTVPKPTASPIAEVARLRIVYYGFESSQPKVGTGIISEAGLESLKDLTFLRVGGTLSPDGTQLAYDSCAGSPRGLFISRLDGGNKKQVATITGDYCVEVRWSSDGTRVSYNGQDDALHIVDIQKRTNTKVPKITGVGWHWWSPNDDYIVYEMGPGSGRQLYITDLSGNSHQLTFPSKLNVCTDVWAPAWSPDGTRIAFTACGALYTVAPDGTNYQRLADSAYSPRWSPKGRYIYYLNGATLLRISVDTQVIQTIGTMPYDGGPFSIAPEAN